MLSVRARERLSRRAHVVVGAALLVAGGGFAAWAWYPQPKSAPQYARCIAQSGTVLYGAFWCEACTAQQERFGAAAPLLPYVECATPDGQRQKEVCRAAGITRYPTWVFPGGARYEGMLTPREAAARAGCLS